MSRTIRRIPRTPVRQIHIEPARREAIRALSMMLQDEEDIYEEIEEEVDKEINLKIKPIFSKLNRLKARVNLPNTWDDINISAWQEIPPHKYRNKFLAN